MCGIAGILWRRPALRPTAEGFVTTMLDSQAHRGPDDRGVSVLIGPEGEELGALGNVRLAIQDPSPAGHQPMEEGGCLVVLNGELYDHLEVREALGGGVSWRSGADTETLLRAHQRWQRDCLGRFRGMFAFALWDSHGRELWCVRDRLGIKPLYYAATEDAFLFASEVRGLLATGLVRGESSRIDPVGLASYARFGAVSEPRTMFQGVRSLEAGSWLRVGGGRVLERSGWWAPAPRSVVSQPLDVIRAELERSVGEHLLSDVPVASLLSSGVDSAVVTALASRKARGRLRTFTLGWADEQLDESPGAEAIARACGTEHATVRIGDAEMVALVRRAVAAMDLPTADGLNTYLVSSVVAAAGIKVVLSGLGGDELFGGYPSFSLVPRAVMLAPLLGRLPRRLVRLAAGGGGRGERAVALLSRGRSIAQRYEEVRALWSAQDLRALGVEPGAALAAWEVGETGGSAALSLLELSGYTRSTLLRDSDVMSMAHSLELRVPLLDHRLVEVCLGARAADGCGLRGKKAVLRALAGELLPPGLLRGRKRGFFLPMDRWLRGVLHGFAREGLEGLQAARLPMRVDGLLPRFLAGRLPWARLWQFVVLGHWLARHPQVLA